MANKLDADKRLVPGTFQAALGVSPFVGRTQSPDVGERGREVAVAGNHGTLQLHREVVLLGKRLAAVRLGQLRDEWRQVLTKVLACLAGSSMGIRANNPTNGMQLSEMWVELAATRGWGHRKRTQTQDSSKRS